MSNGNFGLVQRAVHQIVYQGICQLCMQPTGQPFIYRGRRFTTDTHISPSRAHVEAASLGGKWANGNIFESHLYCNRRMQDLGEADLNWIIETDFSEYTSADTLRDSLNRADSLYNRVLDTMRGKTQITDDVRAVMLYAAKHIIENPETNLVTRIYPKVKNTILKLAA